MNRAHGLIRSQPPKAAGRSPAHFGACPAEGVPRRPQYVGGGTATVTDEPRLPVTVTLLGGTWRLVVSARKPSSEAPVFGSGPMITLPEDVTDTV
jgi:hypothetical protein